MLILLDIALLTITLSCLCHVAVSSWYCFHQIPFFLFGPRKNISTAIMWKIFFHQVYTKLAYVPPRYRRLKKLRVLTINKNLRKSLDSRNGNEILIWSWNNPVKMRRSQFLSGAKQLDVSKRSRTPSKLKRQDNEKNDKEKSVNETSGYLLVGSIWRVATGNIFQNFGILENVVYCIVKKIQFVIRNVNEIGCAWWLHPSTRFKVVHIYIKVTEETWVSNKG